MRRRVVVGEGEVQQVAAACARALRGVDVVSGEQLGEAALVERAGWLTALVGSLAAGVVQEHWNGPDLARLASGVDLVGASLPSQGWMALRRLGWSVTIPEGVYVPDRVVRIAQEQAGRVLRSAWWRAEITAALLATWPADPARRTVADWEALGTALPEGPVVATGVLLARTRQIAAFQARHRRLPAGLTECEQAPGADGQVVLAAVDKQLATLERCPQDPFRNAVLTVRLPARPAPACRADWRPVRIRFRLPPHVPATAVLCPPTLRVRQGRLLLDVPYALAVPKPERAGHRTAVAFDWGLNTLLTGGTLHLTTERQPRVVTDGHPVYFRAAGVLAKADRLRILGEYIGARIDRLRVLITSRQERGMRPNPWLVGKLAVLQTERDCVARRRARLNVALAKAAAGFMTDHAIAAGARVIYLEDLRDMQARGKGRTLNTRLSQTVRGAIVTQLRHQAAVHGIAVVIVPPRGTSKYCPRCLTAFRHHKAPNDPRAGWAWATCPNDACGYSTGRDNAAWQRIGARGLTHQHKTSLDRTSKTFVIRRVVEALDRASRVQGQTRDRTKSGPTAKRPVPGKRRRVPAPPNNRTPTRARPGGKRPAGRTSTHPTHRGQRCPRQQGPTTIGTPARPHRPDGARLGAGFHRHAHTTPTRGQPWPSHPPARSRTPGIAQETQAD
ncbi:zinc ribbon domain-containing protein [Streptomyces sp. NBS 14/10]|uniref:zinc ribbon domain-containing protein n=1 Tax=Streptomyces sp. NBS 14/10 TaxID=1945643 RepID=UPI00211B6B1B|nr:zinc ribbon domain-containing protein [Streptomyces sp. NBS 14/10]KAK1183033.1 zinc ribbon domain-containing protein [Streptomyces sp. NBS 14/10]